MQINTFSVGILFALLAVIFGAFGAHALKTHLSPEHLAIWQTAVQFQFYHALALIIVALWQQRLYSQWLKFAGISFTAGILFFSGSLYLLCLTGVRILGVITPLGGLCFIIGWLCLLILSRQQK